MLHNKIEESWISHVWLVMYGPSTANYKQPWSFTIPGTLVNKNKLIWAISFSQKALTSIHNDALNSHVPGSPEFLVNILSTVFYSESGKHTCESHTASLKYSVNLVLSNTQFGNW